MHPTVEQAVERYLAQIDRLLPGVVTGFYVVGSTAYDAYRDGRSDIDFVAVVDDLTPAQLRRLRLQHQRSGMATALSALRRRRSPTTGTCNGVFVRSTDLARPVSEITPVAYHVGVSFGTGPVGSDVSPVAWKTLAERGIPVRGPHPSTLGLDPQPDLLRSWNMGNLEGYWRPWAERVRRSPTRRFAGRPRHGTAWGMLGPPRLHCTIATGEVVSKEAAGEYALDVFPSRWHPLLADALAYVRSRPSQLRMAPGERARQTTDFVDEVIASAADLP